MRAELITNYDYEGVSFELIKEIALPKSIALSNLVIVLSCAVYSYLSAKLFYNLKHMEIFTEKNFRLIKYYALTTFCQTFLVGLLSKFELDFLKSNISNNAEIIVKNYGEIIVTYGLIGFLTALGIVLIGYMIKKGLEYKKENENE